MVGMHPYHFNFVGLTCMACFVVVGWLNFVAAGNPEFVAGKPNFILFYFVLFCLFLNVDDEVVILLGVLYKIIFGRSDTLVCWRY